MQQTETDTSWRSGDRAAGDKANPDEDRSIQPVNTPSLAAAH